MEYRHELKYVVSALQLALIESRVKHIASLDSHVGETGMYRIRSLYFDDYEDSCFVENEIGTDPREKFRIRIYNANPGRISLELKQKVHGMTRKLSCPLTREQCETLMKGEPLPVDVSYAPVLQKLNLLMRTRGMRPKVIVEYDRVPYVYRLGNTRITLDKNISSSDEILRFLEKDLARRPVMPAGKHILEVKYDEFLPDYLYRSVQIPNLRQTAFSKYYLCRKYRIYTSAGAGL